MPSNVKGIILAAGKGTRFMPATLPVSKSLLPVYDKPMIYYPLETLVRMGIQDILFIVQEEELPIFQKTFGSGKSVGLNFSYQIQKVPRGISDAYLLAEKFIKNSSSVLALSDNVFLGENYFENASTALKKMQNKGGCVFGVFEPEPEKFGVIEFDQNNKILGIEEKPSKPKSKFIIPGMYFFNSEATDYAKTLEPSNRGELEITDLIKIYLNNQKLELMKLDQMVFWFDTGSAETLLEASQAVKQYEENYQENLGFYEIASFEKGFINSSDLEKISDKFSQSNYGKTIKKYLDKI